MLKNIDVINFNAIHQNKQFAIGRRNYIVMGCVETGACQY